MEIIQMKDIRARMHNLSSKTVNEQSNIDAQILIERAKRTKSKSIVEGVLHNWRAIDANDGIALKESVLLFEEISEYCNESFMKSMCNIICEEAIPRVRDGAQTQAYIKQKLGRFKTKVSTKINNNVEDMKNAVTSSIDNFEKNKNQIMDNIKGTSKDKENKKEEVKKECYEKMYNTLENCRVYDRILSNHNKLSKRYNIDKMIDEMAYLGQEEVVYEMCKLIDTYDMDLNYKFNIALENSMYGLYKGSIPYDNSTIVEVVTEYFLMNELVNDDINCIKLALKESRVLSNEDLKSVNYLYRTDIDPYFNKNFLNEEFMNQSDSEVFNDLSNILEASKDNPVKKLLNDFKIQSKNKTPKDVNVLIRKMFSKSPENIIDESPNFFIWIKNFFVFSTFSINIVLGLIVSFTAAFIGMKVKRKEADRMIKVYENDIQKSKKKLKTLKSSADKDKCNKYIQTMEKSLDKLKDYKEDLYSDSENEAKYNDLDESQIDNEELEIIKRINLLETYVDYFVSNGDNNVSKLLNDIESNITKFTLDDIDSLTDIVMVTQDPIKPIQLEEVFTNSIDRVRELDNYNKYMMIDCLNENIYSLKRTKSKFFDEKNIINESYIKSEFMYDLMTLMEELKTIETQGVNEASLTNSLKLASIKLKKAAQNLSDKEKSASRTIDYAMNNLSSAAERSLTVGNREAVIRGSVIPSASKVIKAAIVTGGAALINPVIAVIGLLGTLAVSKKYKVKERQLILDDIEIELKMVDKYIKLAEDKNDLKATKELLVIQRNLERQRQRIKYKMQVEFKQDVPNVAPNTEDN